MNGFVAKHQAISRAFAAKLQYLESGNDTRPSKKRVFRLVRFDFELRKLVPARHPNFLHDIVSILQRGQHGPDYATNGTFMSRK